MSIDAIDVLSRRLCPVYGYKEDCVLHMGANTYAVRLNLEQGFEYDEGGGTRRSDGGASAFYWTGSAWVSVLEDNVIMKNSPPKAGFFGSGTPTENTRELTLDEFIPYRDKFLVPVAAILVTRPFK